MDDVRFIQDARELKALAHPLRTQMLSALRHYGPATSTQLAERFDESTGVTSYHLRQLAKHGFVEEDEDRGKGRERWWRAVHRGTAWRTIDIEHDPLGREASTWMQRRQVQLLSGRIESWIDRQFEVDKAWRAASDLSDYQLRLDPAQLEALMSELHAVVRRHRDVAEQQPVPPGAEQVFLGLVAVPLPPDPLDQR